jgi:hypothetical protein
MVHGSIRIQEGEEIGGLRHTAGCRTRCNIANNRSPRGADARSHHRGS